MKLNCSGKVALITGGSSGIGLATCQLLKTANLDVINFDLQATPEPGIETHLVDVSKPEDVQKVMEKALNHRPSLDYVFANAGIYLKRSMKASSIGDIHQVIDTNVKGTAFVVQACLPHMNTGGHASIVINSSDRALIGKKGSALYGISKSAHIGLVKSLALEHTDPLIRFNAVCPGAIDTPLTQKALRDFADQQCKGNVEQAIQRMLNAYPIGRMGRPEEVAQLVFFLFSDQSQFITGSAISIDGGYTCQ